MIRIPDAKAIRKAAGLSQSHFAHAFGIPVATLRDWEQGRRVPNYAARVLLAIIEADAPEALRIAAKARLAA